MLVSVLLPVHNAAGTLKRAVDSMLGQGFGDFELLLVDNASTDDTPAITQSLAAADSRVRLLQESKQGISFALNHGLRHARGRYVARMDADDVSLPGRLQKQVDFMEQHPPVGLVGGLVEFHSDLPDAQGYAEYVRQLNTWQTPDELYRYRFVESPFAHPSVLFRRELIEQFGFYTEAEEPEDYELWLRWFHHNVPMAKLAEPVLHWNDSAARLSRTDPRCSPEAFDRVRYRYLAQWLQPRLEQLPPIYVWGGGKLASRKMKALQTHGNIPIAGIIDIKEKKHTSLPLLHFSQLPPLGEIFVVSMVSNRGKYLEIEQYLQERGYQFERDFVLAQ